MLFEVLLLLASLVGYVLYKLKQKQSTYWQSRGVKCPPGKFPMGSNPDNCNDVLMGRVNLANVAREQYKLMKGEKYYGTYQVSTPNLVLTDPELVKQILVKDFSHFSDRFGHGMQNIFKGTTRLDEIWRKMLFFSESETWRNTRTVFSPIFTSGKMKAMMSFMQQVNDKLMREFEKKANSKEEVELKELYAKFSMDTIALCVFGVDAQSFTNPKSTFVTNAKLILRRGLIDILKFGIALAVPGGVNIMKALNISVFKATETSFFEEVITTTIRERKKANVKRNDLIDMMIDAMKEDDKENTKEEDAEEDNTKFNHKVDKKELDEVTIVATALTLLLAGYDATSATLSYATYELAMNPDIQKRLQNEIDDAIEDSDGKQPDFTKIQTLEYLDMVFHETLRKYPLINLQRACIIEYTLPGTSIKINKGEDIFINVAGIHSDPKYYPEPEKFNPEHFSMESKAARHPYAFLGFGQGPRNCIGMRFAILEAKISLIALLSKYNVVKSERTVEKVSLDPTSFLATSKDPLYVRLNSRN